MWLRTVVVIYLVSSVKSVVDLDYNIIPEDNLQDLTARTKKSPAEDSNSESDLEIKSILEEDIRRKLGDLKELKNAYEKVETGFFGDSLRSSNGNKETSLFNHEKETSDSSELENDPVRIDRQNYFENSYYNDNINKNYKEGTIYGEKAAHSSNLYTGKTNYQTNHPQEEDDYIAQFNPHARTFNLNGGFNASFLQRLGDLIKPVLTPEIPSATHTTDVSPSKPIEHKPVQQKPLPALQPHPLPALQPHPLPALQPHPLPAFKPHPLPVVSKHKPLVTNINYGAVHSANTEGGYIRPTITSPGTTTYSGSAHASFTTPSYTDVHAPLYYEKKEIGGPHGYFSKQIVFGHNSGGDDHYYAPQQPSYHPSVSDYNPHPQSNSPYGYIPYDYSYPQASPYYPSYPYGQEYDVPGDNYWSPGRGLYFDPSSYSSYSGPVSSDGAVYLPTLQASQMTYSPFSNQRSVERSDDNNARAIEFLKAAIEIEKTIIESLEGESEDDVQQPKASEQDSSAGSDAVGATKIVRVVKSANHSQRSELKSESKKKNYEKSSTNSDIKQKK